MDFELWLINIISSVLVFSDREFQKRVWFEGKDSDIVFSSFVEAYCNLYDDDNFKLFMKEERVIRNVQLHAMLVKFDEKLSAIQGDHFDDQRFNSEEWLEINREATSILHRLVDLLQSVRSARAS